MNLYLDSSALVKRYIQEKDSERVNGWISEAEFLVTGLITRVEVAAAIARVARMQLIGSAQALKALQQLRSDWESLIRLPVTELTVQRGDILAFSRGLRGYDAVHLACALTWQETSGVPVTMLTYDHQLKAAARLENLAVLPEGG